MKRKDHAGQYLARYAEAEAARVALPSRTWRHVLCIPAFDEPHDFLQQVLPHGTSDLLVIVVANVPDHVSQEDAAFVRTRDLLDLAGSFDRARNVDVAIVDRVNAPVPKRAGVGLARKIGADIALRYVVDGRIEVPVIFSTDADAALPADYFEAARGGAAGWVYPFVHVSDDGDLARRALMYELSLRYYVNRLEHVITNRPGVGSRSTALLMAITSGSPARCISSITNGVGRVTKPTGSRRAASRRVGSSSVANVPPDRSLIRRASVVLPACRVPWISTTRAHSRASETWSETCLGNVERGIGTDPNVVVSCQLV